MSSGFWEPYEQEWAKIRRGNVYIRHKSLRGEPVKRGQNITVKEWLMEGAEQ